IDAGHGGTDDGAQNEEGVKEKDLTLALAKAIKEFNINDNIQILLSRPGDKRLTPQQRVAFLDNNKADLVLSLHVNAAADYKTNSKSQPQINIPKSGSSFIKESTTLGSLLSKNLEAIYKEEPLIKQREQKIWILDENKTCPSLLVEFGYMGNAKNMSLFKSPESKKQLAEAVLKTIEQYFSGKENTVVNVKAFKPTNLVKSNFSATTSDIAKLNNTNKARQLTTKGSIVDSSSDYDYIIRASAIYIASKNDTAETDAKVSFKGNNTPKPLVVLDGKEMTWDEFEKRDLKPEQIKEIRVLKDVSATNKYNGPGINGVIEVFTSATTIVSEATPIVSTKTLQWPVDNAKVTTHFGKYTIPGSNFIGRSDGIYMLTSAGTKVKAATAGVVSSIFNLGNVKAVTIRHGNLFTTYSQLSSASVSQGQSVQQGTSIGYAATNENGKGEVLFMVTNTKGQFLDPEKLLAAR
ncbi:MAG TPA: N-acetylmuramoyl-L-alanine amidase, partial [Segetibacter sp.]